MSDEKKTITEEELKAMADEIAEQLDLENEDFDMETASEELDQSDYILELDIENLDDAKFDAENFQRGLDDISEVCGQICGLTNVGVSVADAFTFVINNVNVKHNFEMQKLINLNNVEVSRINSIKIQEQTL